MTKKLRVLIERLIGELDNSELKIALIEELSKNKSFEEMIEDATNANN